MARLGTSDRPLRVAIVGAGPAGLYAAQALLDQPDLVLTIDFGVDLHHHDLKRLYDQIVFAVGAQADRRMSIPGEDLPNSLAALAFVGWYNGHPDYRDLEVDLGCQRAVVVGNGNVAMDVTRMLVRSHDELARTDMADHALEALAASRIREVVVLGRRGAAQASFTTPELRELGRLEGVDVVVDPASKAGSRTTGRPGPTCATSRTTPPAPSGRRRAASPCASWPRRSRCWGPTDGSRRCGSSATS